MNPFPTDSQRCSNNFRFITCTVNNLTPPTPHPSPTPRPPTVQQSSFYGYMGMLPKRYTQGVMTGESE